MKLSNSKIVKMNIEALNIILGGRKTPDDVTHNTYSRTSTMRAMTETEVDVEYESVK